jgi:hypothetical protein
MSVQELMRRSPVCPFCGIANPEDTCAECNQSLAGIEWTAEPRGWSAAKTVGEILLLILAIALFVLPIVHGIGAVFVFTGSWRGVDGAIARLFVGVFITLTAIVEVSLIRGLLAKLAGRWGRKWTFRAANGGGWVQMAAGSPLNGWGQVREDAVLYRWIADYRRGQRTHRP